MLNSNVISVFSFFSFWLAMITVVSYAQHLQDYALHNSARNIGNYHDSKQILLASVQVF